MLHNPVYTGKIRWGYKKDKKIIVDGAVKRTRIIPPEEEQILVEGLHPAIISDEIFNQAQELFLRRGNPSVVIEKELKNPLAGVVVCGICGRPLRYRSNANRRDSGVECRTYGCPCKGSYIYIVEKRIIDALRDWVNEYKLSWDDMPRETHSLLIVKEQAYNAAIKELNTLNKQLDKTHDLLEQGIYDTETFLIRSKSLSEKIAESEKNIAKLSTDINNKKLRENNRKNLIPKVENLIDIYWQLPNVSAKNNMLKEVLEKVEYTKLHTVGRSKTKKLDDFDLVLYPNCQERKKSSGIIRCSFGIIIYYKYSSHV